jgi:hypothetical protein
MSLKIHEYEIDPNFHFFGKNIKLYISCILIDFYVSNISLLLQKNSTSKNLYIMKIKGLFMKLIMFDGAPTQNQKIQWFDLDFSTSMSVIKHNLP